MERRRGAGGRGGAEWAEREEERELVGEYLDFFKNILPHSVISRGEREREREICSVILIPCGGGGTPCLVAASTAQHSLKHVRHGWRPLR